MSWNIHEVYKWELVSSIVDTWFMDDVAYLSQLKISFIWNIYYIYIQSLEVLNVLCN
jgi:hypothetical protein